MKRIAIPALAAVLLFACAEDVPISERFSGPWREDFSLAITQTLAHNDIRGCGQYEFKVSTRQSSEFLVRCTRDGENWVTYLVRTDANTVSRT